MALSATTGNQAKELRDEFRRCIGTDCHVFRAPGRVNLIGEHTDYNDGFVMPAAIQFYTWVAIAQREDRRITVRSASFEDSLEFSLADSGVHSRHHWSDYVRGVAMVLQQLGHELRGADLLIHGEVPIGSGLSSSAALEVSTGLALLAMSGIAVDLKQLALACQKAEIEYAGARVGIMDQFISCLGSKDHALRLDCRSLDYQLIKLPAGVSLVVCNSMVKHDLATGEYNVRRAECEKGVQLLSRSLPGITALRDVTQEQLEQHSSELPPVIRQRCRHVVSENARVLEAAAALKSDDLDRVGRLMRESHISLRDDYQVSCPELDTLVELAWEQPGTIGARMTGGGFGGCTVNLVRDGAVAEFRDRVAEGYCGRMGKTPEIYVTTAAQGAQQVL